MSASEFAEWQAFARLEPFGPLRDDQRAGTIAAVMANIHRSKKRRQPYTWRDFFRATPKQPQTWQEMLGVAEAFTALYGGEDKRNRAP